MDLNLVVLCGRLAAPPEHRRFDTGMSLLRLLVAVTSDTPHRRLDLIPVTFWDPPDDLLEGALAAGVRIWVSGRMRRHLEIDVVPGQRSSRLEVVATTVVPREESVDART